MKTIQQIDAEIVALSGKIHLWERGLNRGPRNKYNPYSNIEELLKDYREQIKELQKQKEEVLHGALSEGKQDTAGKAASRIA